MTDLPTPLGGPDGDAFEPAPLPPDLAAELRSLADTTCPPDVLAAALAHAAPLKTPRRRAADRPARAGRSRRAGRWLPVALAVAAVLAVAGLALRGGEAPEPLPAVAETVPPRPETMEPAPVPAPDVPPSPEAAAPPPAAMTAPPVAVPTPVPTASAPPDLAVAATPPAVEDDPTPAEVEAATRDLQLALALVAGVQDQADRALRDQTGALRTIDAALPHLDP